MRAARGCRNCVAPAKSCRAEDQAISSVLDQLKRALNHIKIIIHREEKFILKGDGVPWPMRLFTSFELRICIKAVCLCFELKPRGVEGRDIFFRARLWSAGTEIVRMCRGGGCMC